MTLPEPTDEDRELIERLRLEGDLNRTHPTPARRGCAQAADRLESLLSDREQGSGGISGSRASTEPQEGLGPSGFDPGRIAELEKIIRDTLWMAQRYADGRMTYAVGLYNDAAEAAMRLGVVPIASDLFARDGMAAIAMEAGTGETEGLDPKDDSAGRQASPNTSRTDHTP